MEKCRKYLWMVMVLRKQRIWIKSALLIAILSFSSLDAGKSKNYEKYMDPFDLAMLSYRGSFKGMPEEERQILLQHCHSKIIHLKSIYKGVPEKGAKIFLAALDEYSPNGEVARAGLQIENNLINLTDDINGQIQLWIERAASIDNGGKQCGPALSSCKFYKDGETRRTKNFKERLILRRNFLNSVLMFAKDLEELKIPRWKQETLIPRIEGGMRSRTDLVASFLETEEDKKTFLEHTKDLENCDIILKGNQASLLRIQGFLNAMSKERFLFDDLINFYVDQRRDYLGEVYFSKKVSPSVSLEFYEGAFSYTNDVDGGLQVQPLDQTKLIPLYSREYFSEVVVHYENTLQTLKGWEDQLNAHFKTHKKITTNLRKEQEKILKKASIEKRPSVEEKSTAAASPEGVSDEHPTGMTRKKSLRDMLHGFAHPKKESDDEGQDAVMEEPQSVGPDLPMVNPSPTMSPRGERKAKFSTHPAPEEHPTGMTRKKSLRDMLHGLAHPKKEGDDEDQLSEVEEEAPSVRPASPTVNPSPTMNPRAEHKGGGSKKKSPTLPRTSHKRTSDAKKSAEKE